MSKPRLHCAIYTRKSSDEGLDQDFNSLQAQREACEAYVRSQAGEGWTVLKTAYDDGGFSGGSMDRPGLEALLADIRRQAIDIVLVYKVDRLTRSLADFAKIVEAFDAEGVSFVSVTQAFNTTSSMGRLTLNVLLSFAQFEREVTGERIRDKIAASKAKGMWMGGRIPLGYVAVDRRLMVSPDEAEQVRQIFAQYLELGSVHALKDQLDQQGVVSKRWTNRKGEGQGGAPISRGALFHILRNPVHVGQVRHKTLTYSGQHEPIVDRAVFDAVQASLNDNVTRHANMPARIVKSPLLSLVQDADGVLMSPSFVYGRRGKLHRYYVSTTLRRGAKAVSDGVIRRVAAGPIEAIVLDRVQTLFGRQLDWPQARDVIQKVELQATCVQISVNAGDLISREGLSRDLLVGRGQMGDRISNGQAEDEIVIAAPVRPIFRGGRSWLVSPGGLAPIEGAKPDVALVKALCTAHAWQAKLNASPMTALADLHDARSPADSCIRRLTPLAFLAPDIQRAILEGRQPPWLTLQQLISKPLPLAWIDQKRALGFDA